MSTDLGQQIRRARKAREWTQQDLAQQAGVAPNTVIAMEQGRRVRPGNRTAVLAALGLPLEAPDGTVRRAQVSVDVVHHQHPGCECTVQVLVNGVPVPARVVDA